jgi:large subunit ribosomal protein L13
MRAKRQDTYTTSANEIERKWYVVDAEGQTLGRLAAKIVPYLTGKTKPIYSPNLDCGDFIVVINCEKIHVTGKKLDDKIYYRYSGFMGGLKRTTLREMLRTHPDRALHHAIHGMMQKQALGHQTIKKLKIYAGKEHPHEAQKPEVLVL